MPFQHAKRLVVGVTGGIGSGKSLTLSILRRKGIPVLSADEVGHRLLRRAGIACRVRRAFGKGVSGPRGRIDRKKLSALVFACPRHVKRLNRILHPAIRAGIRSWMKNHRRPAAARLMAVEVPLLYESRFADLFDGVLSISAPAAHRRRRVGRKPFAQRARYQWSQAVKDRNADWVIRNTSTRQALARSLARWMKTLERDAP